jgi:hypothetical protein
MRRVLSIFVLSAVAACAVAADPTEGTEASVHAAPELTLPLDAKTLTNELVRRGVRTKSDALALLPRAMKQRFVLMKSTGALGVATPDRPRVIHFEEDGRFILASTGHAIDEDVTANSLEILEEDSATHQYRTHVISFDADKGATLTEDDQRCKGCHGAPARPIWGSYPNWPDAYGADDDKMTPEEHASFDAFVETAKTDPAYRHLEIHPSSYGFYLPLPYGYPNTNINQALGIRWAAQLAERMTKSPHYAELANAVVMASLYCDYSSATEAFIESLYRANTFEAENRYPAHRAATKVYRLLGVEPTTDLRVENPLPVPPSVDYDVGMAPWDAGSDYLTNLIAYPIFSALLKADPELSQLYASQLSKIAYADDITFKGDLTTMMSLTRDSTPTYYDANHFSAYNYVHQPVLDGEGKRAAVCARLASKLP